MASPHGREWRRWEFLVRKAFGQGPSGRNFSVGFHAAADRLCFSRMFLALSELCSYQWAAPCRLTGRWSGRKNAPASSGVKRREVIRHLEKNGCEFLREGANHTIYIN